MSTSLTPLPPKSTHLIIFLYFKWILAFSKEKRVYSIGRQWSDKVKSFLKGVTLGKYCFEKS